MTATGTVAAQLNSALRVYQDNAWQRCAVPVFRLSSSPDGHGGSLTSPGTTRGDVMADPVIQEGGQMLVVDRDAEIQVGDLVRIQHSQFRDDPGDS